MEEFLGRAVELRAAEGIVPPGDADEPFFHQMSNQFRAGHTANHFHLRTHRRLFVSHDRKRFHGRTGEAQFVPGAFESREPRVVSGPRQELITARDFFDLEGRVLLVEQLGEALEQRSNLIDTAEARGFGESSGRERFVGHHEDGFEAGERKVAAEGIGGNGCGGFASQTQSERQRGTTRPLGERPAGRSAELESSMIHDRLLP